MINKDYDLDIYPESIIRQAINDYSNICKIKADIKDGFAFLSFSDSVYDINQTVQEFSNYLIDLIGVNHG